MILVTKGVKWRFILLLFSSLGFFFACSSDNSSDIGVAFQKHELYGDTGKQNTSLEGTISLQLDGLKSADDFTLMVVNKAGREFVYNRGTSSRDSQYLSASASKFVTAVVLLALVDEGILALDDKPQDWIDFWPDTGLHADMQLKHLLSFTSGLQNSPLCVYAPDPLAWFGFPKSLEGCVKDILKKNAHPAELGAGYYYASTHMQLAGLMAVKALGVASWADVFNRFKEKTGLFSHSQYSLFTAENPILAAGMHYTASDYMIFLKDLVQGKLLNADLRKEMFSTQIGAAKIQNSPAKTRIAKNWLYGFGVWIECEPNDTRCEQSPRVSSPSVYGSYPFIDFKRGYFGIVASQGNRLSNNFQTGYQIFQHVEKQLEAWAAQ